LANRHSYRGGLFAGIQESIKLALLVHRRDAGFISSTSYRSPSANHQCKLAPRTAQLLGIQLFFGSPRRGGRACPSL
jgi:hypothetical protein